MSARPFGCRSRTKYKPEQIQLLESTFAESHYPDAQILADLAMKMDVAMDKLNIWFQNRRAKFKKQSKGNRVNWMRSQIFNTTSGGDVSHVLSPPNQSDSPKVSTNLHYFPEKSSALDTSFGLVRGGYPSPASSAYSPSLPSRHSTPPLDLSCLKNAPQTRTCIGSQSTENVSESSHPRLPLGVDECRKNVNMYKSACGSQNANYQRHQHTFLSLPHLLNDVPRGLSPSVDIPYGAFTTPDRSSYVHSPHCGYGAPQEPFTIDESLLGPQFSPCVSERTPRYGFNYNIDGCSNYSKQTTSFTDSRRMPLSPHGYESSSAFHSSPEISCNTRWQDSFCHHYQHRENSYFQTYGSDSE